MVDPRQKDERKTAMRAFVLDLAGKPPGESDQLEQADWVEVEERLVAGQVETGMEREAQMEVWDQTLSGVKEQDLQATKDGMVTKPGKDQLQE